MEPRPKLFLSSRLHYCLVKCLFRNSDNSHISKRGNAVAVNPSPAVDCTVTAVAPYAGMAIRTGRCISAAALVHCGAAAVTGCPGNGNGRGSSRISLLKRYPGRGGEITMSGS